MKDNTTFVKATLLLASTLTVMSGATVSPALPAIQAAFADTPNVELLTRLVLTMPALFIVLGSPFVGAIIDRFGRKTLLTVSTVLYAVAGASGFVLDSLVSILIGRALLGLAVAGILTTVTTLIADYFEGEARAQLLGLQGAFTSMGGVIFLVFGGILADLSWRAPFLIYVASLALLPLIIFQLYEPEQVSSAQQQGELAIPRSLLGLIYGAALISQIVFYMIPVQLPYFLALLTGAGGTQSGLAIATATVFSTVSALLYGRVKTRLGYVQITTLAFGTMGVGFAIIGLSATYWSVLLGLAVTGLALGLLFPNLNTWLTEVAPSSARGRAVGGLTMALFLGQFLSPIVSQPIISVLSYGLTYVVMGGLVATFAVILILFRIPLKRLTAASQS